MDATRPSPAAGYDPNFLGIPLPLPAPIGGMLLRELPYTHFTVLLNPDRGLAQVTGVNIDGNQLLDVNRDDSWMLDSRIPVAEQTGEAVYARNDLDRGHLVRRRDPVWGDPATARQANTDTFHYTNAAPQAGDFNQSKDLWLGLEDHVLAYAQTNRNRLSVFTAPILADSDPLYRGVQIPQQFWKIAAWTTTGSSPTLRAAGFILDQTAQLDDIDLTRLRAETPTSDAPPPLGPFRTYQVPISDLETITALNLAVLSEADVLVSQLTVHPHKSSVMHWHEIWTTADLQLKP